MEYIVKLTWDNDAGVWVAESDDVPGLVLESGSFDALVERVRFAIPELLELNVPPQTPFFSKMTSGTAPLQSAMSQWMVRLNQDIQPTPS